MASQKLLSSNNLEDYFKEIKFRAAALAQTIEIGGLPVALAVNSTFKAPDPVRLYLTGTDGTRNFDSILILILFQVLDRYRD